MQIGDLVRLRNARKAMGLVVKVNDLYIEVQWDICRAPAGALQISWVGKSCAYNRTYQKYKLEVINASR